MAKELELKLACTQLVSAEDLEDGLLSAGAELAPEGSALVQLRNTYYDTLELDLRQQRIALRIRQAGNRYIQTLKTAGKSINGIHQRGEWEWELPNANLDISLIGDIEHEVLGKPIINKPLSSIFTTDFSRLSRVIHFMGHRFEVVLDQGSIRVPGSSEMESILEIEVEHLSGELEGSTDLSEKAPNILVELSNQLCSLMPLTPMDESKAQRGYALFDKLMRQKRLGR